VNDLVSRLICYPFTLNWFPRYIRPYRKILDFYGKGGKKRMYEMKRKERVPKVLATREPRQKYSKYKEFRRRKVFRIEFQSNDICHKSAVSIDESGISRFN
jgi:hypothetical protein